jgi:uncharacterized protein YlxP (DUF503 family)
MYAAALRVELRIRDARSLKEKRRIVKSVMSQLTTKLPVAVAEVGFQDQWQRCTLGVATVSSQAGQLDRILHTVQRLLRERPDIEVLHASATHLEDPA